MGMLMSAGITAFLLAAPARGTDGRTRGTLCIRCACQVYTCDDDWRRVAKKVAEM
eukprot:gene51035-52101_t